MSDPSARLARVAARILGRDLTASEVEMMSKYLDLLLEWNKTQRLIGSDDRSWIVDNLLLDSLLFLEVLPPAMTRLLDVGSGAGVPGIPIKIVRPEVDVVMVEARRKRASFISTVVRELGLRGARVINAQMETLLPQAVGVFDAVTARCTSDPESVFTLTRAVSSLTCVVVVSGPPVKGALPPEWRWVEVMSPVTGGVRNFAVHGGA